MTLAPFPFDAHLDLVAAWLDRRVEMADRIERSLLNVQGKTTSRRRDREFFDRAFSAGVFELPGVPRELASLRGQLRAWHVADGFEPVRRDAFATELDPLELLVRAYDHWDAHRWPGASGRLTYAHGLVSVFLFRQIEGLSLRVWDAGDHAADGRLAAVQRLLDRLNEPPGPVTFVRDAAWLTQTAQGPLTPHLEPYFRVAAHVARSFTPAVRVAIHAAGAKLAGGHMRSQLRYGVWRTGHAIDHPEIVAFTRNTNAMDHGLLVGDLVGLLEAYRTAVDAPAGEQRLDLAEAILEGLSVDPDLYLVRQDLLAAYTTVEALHLSTDSAGRTGFTDAGLTARAAARRCTELLAALAPALAEDAPAFDPRDHAYSPFGIVYGFVSDLLSNMAMSVLVGRQPMGGSLEDVFESRRDLEAKRRRAETWATLPRRAGEREHFEHTIAFAVDVYDRLIKALHLRVEAGARLNASSRPSTRLFLTSADVGEGDVPAGAVTNAAFVFTSDEVQARDRGQTFAPADRMESDRREGAFLASAEVDGALVGVSKLVLTLGIGQGRDVVVRGLAAELGDRLQRVGGALVSAATPAPEAS